VVGPVTPGVRCSLSARHELARRPSFLAGSQGCRRLVTASIAGETAPVTVCFLATRACASTLFPWGPRSDTGLA